MNIIAFWYSNNFKTTQFFANIFIKLFLYTIIFHQLHTEIDISNIQPKDKATMPTEETHRGGSNEECINVKNVS